jgi:hypothetical protein
MQTIESLPLNEQVEYLSSVLIDRANREQQSYDLGGPFDFPSPYRDALNQIDAAIGRLKSMRREMQRVASHSHDWNDNDYCSVCRADGRA